MTQHFEPSFLCYPTVSIEDLPAVRLRAYRPDADEFVDLPIPSDFSVSDAIDHAQSVLAERSDLAHATVLRRSQHGGYQVEWFGKGAAYGNAAATRVPLGG